MADLETFEQQLQHCLTHLYDFLFLQNYLLVRELITEDNSANRVQAFREKIIQALESIRPASAVAFHARSARPYNVLNMRYVDQLDTETIITRLALSKRQFWREHAKGLQLLSSILQQTGAGSEGLNADDNPVNAADAGDADHLNEYEDDQDNINLHDLFASVLESIESLADQHRITIQVAEVDESIVFEGDWTLLRQIILALLMRAIAQNPGSGTLDLDYRLQDFSLQFGITVVRHDAKFVTSECSETLTFLLKRLDAELVEPGDGEFRLTIPLKHKTVLVIDDNADVVNLFRRYLTDTPYRLLAADNGHQGLELAYEGLADVIILDIMLPKQDGFQVLQTLKANPQTRHIPVLVCSILDVQELAFSLGAQDYLHKPPGQHQLLHFLTKHFN